MLRHNWQRGGPRESVRIDLTLSPAEATAVPSRRQLIRDGTPGYSAISRQGPIKWLLRRLWEAFEKQGGIRLRAIKFINPRAWKKDAGRMHHLTTTFMKVATRTLEPRSAYFPASTASLIFAEYRFCICRELR